MNRAALVLVALGAACGAGPVFNSAADREYGEDRPCYLAPSPGEAPELQPGWHQCARTPGPACCPIGESCGEDDFIPSRSAGICHRYELP